MNVKANFYVEGIRGNGESVKLAVIAANETLARKRALNALQWSDEVDAEGKPVPALSPLSIPEKRALGWRIRWRDGEISLMRKWTRLDNASELTRLPINGQPGVYGIIED